MVQLAAEHLPTITRDRIMRYTFTNEIRESPTGIPQAVFQMWQMNGFGPWEKKSFHGTASKFEDDLKKLYIYFSSDENNEYHNSDSAYCEERVDMNEFLKGYKAIQAYRELNSG
ncbi:MAG: hypothetical protein H6937_13335 [Burkholderiales bacterium]|nr:hypothetical protein [Burkholderiales bacterium]